MAQVDFIVAVACCACADCQRKAVHTFCRGTTGSEITVFFKVQQNYFEHGPIQPKCEETSSIRWPFPSRKRKNKQIWTAATLVFPSTSQWRVPAE